MTDPLRVVVLISGRGSNLGALLEAQSAGRYQVVAVISNKATAAGLVRARQSAIATTVVDHRKFPTRRDFEAQLADAIDQFKPGLVVLAGFMRVLEADFVRHYAGRMINIHPSLLPRFRGLNTHERALEAAVQYHGASVHFVTAELDGGPVIAQIALQIGPADSAQTLAARLLPLEHQLLTTVVGWVAQGIITYDDGVAIHQGKPLTSPLRVTAGN